MKDKSSRLTDFFFQLAFASLELSRLRYLRKRNANRRGILSAEHSSKVNRVMPMLAVNPVHQVREGVTVDLAGA